MLTCDLVSAKGKETAAAAAAAAAEAETATPPEPLITPSETIYMQIVDFLLDTKATPVKRSRSLSDSLVVVITDITRPRCQCWSISRGMGLLPPQ